MDASQKTLQELKAMTVSNRELFVQLLKQSNNADTTGACLYASVMCSLILNKFTDATVSVRGGDGEGDGGLFVDGVGHGHYWLEADINGDLYIVDVTADQFGLPPIIVERIEVMSQIYVPGCQETVDEHVLELKTDITKESVA